MKYIGVDIGGTNLKAGIVDEDGTLLAVRKMKVATVADSAMLARTIFQLSRELCDDCGSMMDEIASVGVGCPGTVEIHSGSILYTCNLPLRNVPLRRLFHQFSSLPLYIENDANCAALAEYHVGAGRTSKRFVTITLGTGIGGGIIHNGKIWHGSNGIAGEVGHMTIDLNGELCPCGRRGCWERYASASALKRQTANAMEKNPESILAQVVSENDGHVSGQSAFMAARKGCHIGQKVCDDYIAYLAAGITNIVNIFQPDTLAIGGGVSNERDEQLLYPICQKVSQDSIPCTPDRRTRIVKAQLGTDAGIIGAALLGKNKRI